MRRGAKRALDYPVDVRSLPEKGHPLRIDASPEEREALARENELLSLDSLVADVTVEPWRSDGVRVVGTLRARLEQECVATLEPVAGLVEERIDTTLVPEGSPLAREAEGELILDPNGDDPPETFQPPYVEVGALVSEFLTLALDPYPRLSDAALPDEATDAEPAGPFAALARLQAGKD